MQKVGKNAEITATPPKQPEAKTKESLRIKFFIYPASFTWNGQSIAHNQSSHNTTSLQHQSLTFQPSDMDGEIEALEQRLAKTRALKQGMMQALLTGRTRLV